MKNLRLLLTERCNRNCEGCCNKDWDLKSLPVCTDYSPYEVIMLTGGEVMLNTAQVKSVISDIRATSMADIYIYTAKVDNPLEAKKIYQMVEGFTLTLHEQSDVEPFLYFAGIVADIWYRSNRLNIFEGIDIKFIPPGWQVKSNIQWIKNCPLPSNEVFMRVGG